MPKFDQHFLHDRTYAKKIAEAVELLPGETLLEVGPGRGALTQFLLQKPVPYIGIEIDPRVIETLRALPGAEHATFLQGDFLQVPLPEKPLFFVSNLPYSITGPALFRILEHRFWIRAGVIMLQAEVAQRLYAAAGKRPYGRLSVLFQSVYAVKRLFRVPPGAFSPPPKVWSEVVFFTRQPQVALEEWDSFAAFVRRAFQHPRRTLAKNLAPLGVLYVEPWGLLRPHQLSVANYILLWRSYGDRPPTGA